jgi:LuxR family maltose regulon positive regulatory protein
LGSDLRAVALMNLGTVEAWSLGLPEAERHLREGAILAREIGRPYLEVGCLAQLGFAYIFHGAAMPKIQAFATTQRRCREAIALAELYGWGTEPVIAPALMTLAGTMVFLGEFDVAEQWLRRTERALEKDTGPDIRLLLHQTTGILHACRGRRHKALEEFGAAEHLASQLEGSQALGLGVGAEVGAGLAGRLQAAVQLGRAGARPVAEHPGVRFAAQPGHAGGLVVGGQLGRLP